MRNLLLACLATALSAALPAHAADFVFDMEAPNLRVTIPNLPAMKMEAHPMRAEQPHMRYLGSQGPYTVSVFTPTAAEGMTPLECAGAIVRVLAKRPNVPPSQEIFKTRLDERTYAAMYAVSLGGAVQLNAHLLSAAGGAQCVEVHASKMSTSPDELEPWFKGFDGARIESR